VIRSLPVHEIPLLLPLARQFHDSLLHGMLNHAPLNEAHFLKVLERHLTVGTGFVLVAGSPIRGMISGMMFEDMSTGELCCMEFFWFVDPNERGSIGIRLLDALEEEARKRGAVRVLMAHLASEKTAKFAKLYERRGYELKEQIFYKGIEPCAA
jgi:GNAT superfamily N-acetyltransferase